GIHVAVARGGQRVPRTAHCRWLVGDRRGGRRRHDAGEDGSEGGGPLMATPSKARAVREPEPESRSVADQTIAVLAKHYPRETSYDAGWLEGCACGAWEVETPTWDTDNEVSWAL